MEKTKLFEIPFVNREYEIGLQHNEGKVTDTVFESHTTVSKTIQNESSYKCFHPLIVLGQMLGLLPKSIQDKVQNGHSRATVLSVYAWIVTILISVNPTINIVEFVLKPKQTPFDIADAIKTFLCTLWAVIIHVHFLTKAEGLVDFFQAWESSSRQIIYQKKDSSLRRDIKIILLIIFVSAFLENSLLHYLQISERRQSWSVDTNLKYHTSQEDTGVLMLFKTWFEVSQPEAAELFGTNWIFSVLSFVEHKWFLYTWNYVDVFIAALSRALYFKFKALYEVAGTKLLQLSSGRMEWNQMAYDYKAIIKLLDKLECFISPLIFGSYAVNIFYICMAVFYNSYVVNETTGQNFGSIIYRTWSMVHLMMRTYVMSICCARINDHATRLRKLVADCPIEYYFNGEIERLDRMLMTGSEIGLTGLGCFTVTKAFTLSIVGVVLTFEIVLLQYIPERQTM